MKAPNGKLSGDGSVQGRRHEGHLGPVTPQIFFVSIKFCCGQKNLFETYDKSKIIFPKYVDLSCPQTLKPGYGPGSAKIVSAIRIFCFEGHTSSRCSITFF